LKKSKGTTMQIENTYDSDDETRLYATDPNWKCGIEDEENVQLGVYAQIQNYYQAGLDEMPEDYPLGISFSVVAHDPKVASAAAHACSGYTDGQISIMPADVRQVFARETLLEYQGGVPADRMLYRGIRRSDESDAFGVLVERYEGKSKVIEINGQPVLAFAKWEDAEDCARFLLEERAPLLCGLMIGFFLDAPINGVGQNGWSMITTAVRGEDWSPIPASMG
jgi:hypothetical protein